MNVYIHYPSLSDKSGTVKSYHMSQYHCRKCLQGLHIPASDIVLDCVSFNI